MSANCQVIPSPTQSCRLASHVEGGSELSQSSAVAVALKIDVPKGFRHDLRWGGVRDAEGTIVVVKAESISSVGKKAIVGAQSPRPSGCGLKRGRILRDNEIASRGDVRSLREVEANVAIQSPI